MLEYPRWWWHLGDLGILGVRIFFVLSGFIITHLLLRESDRRGDISLRAFYVRRAFRIIPPVVALLGIVGLGVLYGYVQVPARQFVLSLAFLGNYVGASGSWTLGHLWTLGVEEQFYLFWPAVLALTIRCGKRRLFFVLGSLVLAPFLRVIHLAHGAISLEGFVENSDALAMGALAAMIFSGAMFVRFRRLLESVPALVSGLMIFVFHLEPVPAALKVTVCYPLIHLCVAALILRVIKVARDPGTRMLSVRPMVFIGVISYSLYLFQQPVFNRPPLAVLPGFPWSVLLAFGLATASHFCIERPSMKLRDRFLERHRGHFTAPSSS